LETANKVKVVNNRPSRVTLRRVVATTPQLLMSEMHIEGGANVVDAAEFEKYMMNTICKSFVDEGMFTVEPFVDGTLDTLPKYIVDLSKLKPKIALNAIANTKDLRQLTKWIQQDGRNEIRAALIKRHEELTKDEDVEKVDAD
jgi:hypothetical protein